MTEVTSPIMLDSTGQQIVSQLTRIANKSVYQNIYYKDFVFSNITYTAGAVGSRGSQVSISAVVTGYTPVGCSIVTIGASTDLIPVVFLSGTNLYANSYRTKTTAMASNYITARVFYTKN